MILWFKTMGYSYLKDSTVVKYTHKEGSMVRRNNNTYLLVEDTISKETHRVNAGKLEYIENADMVKALYE